MDAFDVCKVSSSKVYNWGSSQKWAHSSSKQQKQRQNIHRKKKTSCKNDFEGIKMNLQSTPVVKRSSSKVFAFSSNPRKRRQD